MKQPLKRGNPVDMPRMSRWLSLFTMYRHGINEERIGRWLSQFDRAHCDEAARILDCVEFITHEQMAAAFRASLATIPGWSADPSERSGSWRFAAFSGSPGESGDTMLHRFRVANSMGARRYSKLFVYKSQLLGEGLGPQDTVVFVDDFAGTGNQVCSYWMEMQELLPGGPNTYLILVAASTAAVDKISAETDLVVMPHIQLTDADNIFSPRCTHFTDEEKSILLRYCTRANARAPKGYGDCGLVVVFAHDCPNDSIPILHANHRRWEGLFRRHG